MTWEETILYIRKLPEYKTLVEQAYLEEKLDLNIERYLKSDELNKILLFFKKYSPKANSILDIGSGNGISAIAFALNGYHVTAVEPDPSFTIGAGAIRKLKEFYQLENISIIESYAENAGFERNSFDIIFCRQSMHHANDLNTFVSNLSSFLRPGGLFITVRDHVVFNEMDKLQFLQTHPLQKYYGGENAYSSKQYRKAIKMAQLDLIKEIRYFDDSINYFPQSEKELISIVNNRENVISSKAKKIPLLSALLIPLFRTYLRLKCGPVLDETTVPGRMYSYIAIKKS